MALPASVLAFVAAAFQMRGVRWGLGGAFGRLDGRLFFWGGVALFFLAVWGRPGT